MKIVLTDFVRRQFDPAFAGTKIPVPPDEFEGVLAKLPPSRFVDGYAPFCKHLFIPNTFGVLSGTALITDTNRHLLCSDYEARREGELPVLTRWFPADKVAPQPAVWLDLVLYSSLHLHVEGEKIAPSADWGVVAILATDTQDVPPMDPITAMRNALGIAEGGSGVRLDHAQYALSVDYWRRFALIR